jgi:hypothetical protein
LQPPLLLHGHVNPDPVGGRDHRLGRTLVRNVTGWQLFDLDPATGQVADVTGHHSAGYNSAGHRPAYDRAGPDRARFDRAGYRDAR